MYLIKEEQKWLLGNDAFKLEICIDKNNTPGKMFSCDDLETEIIQNMRAGYKYEEYGEIKQVWDFSEDETDELMTPESIEAVENKNFIEVHVSSISKHFKLKKRYMVYRDVPFLRCRYELYPCKEEGKGPASLMFPVVKTGPYIIDPIDRDEDLYSDGTDLGMNFEIPPWRVFYSKCGKPELFIFTYNKQLMKKMHVMHGNLGFRHSSFESYSGAQLPGWDISSKGDITSPEINDFFIAPVFAGKEEYLTEITKMFSVKKVKNQVFNQDIYIAHPQATVILKEIIPAGLDEITKVKMNLIQGGTGELLLRIPQHSTLQAMYIPENKTECKIKVEIDKIPDVDDAYLLTVKADKEANVGFINGVLRIFDSAFAVELDFFINLFEGIDLNPEKDERIFVYKPEKFASKSVITDMLDENKWLVMNNMPGTAGGTVITAKGASMAPNIEFDPQLKGRYKIYAGIGCGAGIAIKLSSDDYFDYINNQNSYICAFYSPVSNCQKAEEIYFKTADLTDKKIIVGRYPSAYGVTMINYIKFVPDVNEPVTINKTKNTKNFKLTGLNDICDIGSMLGANAPDPEPYLSNVRAHAALGFDRIYWRVDGQCCDFHTKVGTVRYPSAKVHDLFIPSSRGYGRFLAKHDALVLAVKEAHDNGMEIYGWWRMNNYGLNVVPEFYTKHPEYHEVGPDGRKIPKLCFAIPEVRKWKIDILKEVAERGVDGLVLGVLRHPPMLNYHPVLVEGFKSKYGVYPPALKEPSKDPDDLTKKWLYYRADFLTILVKELRKELAAIGKANIKLSVWIRPSCYLYDGVDLDRWLGEGLVQEVIVATYRGDDVPGPLELQTMIQKKAEMQVEINGFETKKERIIEEIERLKRRKVDGVCIYESDLSVIRPVWRSLLPEVLI